MNSIIFPTICLNNSRKIAELWIKCTVWRRGSCEARGYSLALMMSGDGGRAEAEVVSSTVIFSRIKKNKKKPSLLKQRCGPVSREEAWVGRKAAEEPGFLWLSSGGLKNEIYMVEFWIGDVIMWGRDGPKWSLVHETIQEVVCWCRNKIYRK